MNNQRRTMRMVLSILAAMAMVLVLPATGTAQRNAVENDINGDGAGDLLVGVPLEGVSGLPEAGSVNVILSNGNRLTTAGNKVLSQGGKLPDVLEAEDRFGGAVELIDIDNDGFADAVIGSPGESDGLAVNAGMFHVVYGTADGLDRSRAVAYRQGSDGLPGTSEVDDFLGFAIGSGDFNGDGFGDVAVTAPFEDVGSTVRAGGVLVVLGSGSGLDTSTAAWFSQKGKVNGEVEEADLMGWAVTSGDFDGDGFDDLALGTPGENYRSRENSGAVNVLYGSKDGITRRGDQLFGQAGSIAGKPQTNDLFGFALAATDIDCDGTDDLLVGVPNEGVDGVDPAGMVNVILGSSKGLTRAGNTRLHQGQLRIAGSADFNQFGASLVGGDFNGDGCGDVVVGAHTTNVGGSGALPCASQSTCRAEAGAVVVVYGARSWPRPGGSAPFNQRGAVAGAPAAGDWFGRTLAAVDINGDARDDLVVGIPQKDHKGRSNAGAIVVIEGSADGLSAADSYVLSQRGRIKGRPEAGDQFSSALFGGGS